MSMAQLFLDYVHKDGLSPRRAMEIVEFAKKMLEKNSKELRPAPA
jgi:hypothetical protein